MPMNQELEKSITALAEAIAAFKAEHPEEYAAAEAELAAHAQAMTEILESA